MRKQYATSIQVVHSATGEVVKTIDCARKNCATIDKIESGIWLSLDHDNYHTKRVTRKVTPEELASHGS